ncbi:dihydroorotate dehydrogenase electron transfer subunit [Amphibacillus jilinensis]|uniref:dihydroorotate dehydrogenase electron transfer subunit n=1 Tax=Amphibacillus jilinensis TaxID=1216008 RepID=UPI00031AE2EC|nr:dihydroorotate dehydrogenase electron transfer subunit [Amphibacillus jilinensis]
MKVCEAVIDDIKQIARDTMQVHLKVEANILQTIKPGQFVHIQVNNGTEHMLRRPISVANIDQERQLLTIVFKVFGQGTAKLAAYEAEQSINLLIPCGQGYPIEELQIKKALLIGGGIGVPPLYYLARQLAKKNIEIISVLGFQTQADVFYQQDFEAFGQCFVTTMDGSYGYKGVVTDVIKQEHLLFDYYFSCGPTAMLRAVQTELTNYPGYISLEERMGCGIGACYACVVPSKDQATYKKICQDGPVFRANEVSI